MVKEAYFLRVDLDDGGEESRLIKIRNILNSNPYLEKDLFAMTELGEAIELSPYVWDCDDGHKYKSFTFSIWPGDYSDVIDYPSYMERSKEYTDRLWEALKNLMKEVTNEEIRSAVYHVVACNVPARWSMVKKIPKENQKDLFIL